jgi:hypothetical protein
MMSKWYSFLFILWLSICAVVPGADTFSQSTASKVSVRSKKQIWKKISPYFAPPPEFADSLGSYRSPLKFYNGRLVRSSADWERRRNEIKNQWHRMMGEWPEVLTEQRFEFLDSTQQTGFMQYRVRFLWMPGQPTEGYLLVPDGSSEKKRPAVITVFYEPETAIGNGKAERYFALDLARRGFVTLSIGTTEASEAKTYSLYYPSIENAEVQPLSMLAYAAANAWNVLAKVPGVDSTRIGIMGHSFGGKWAMFASCLYEKFACAVWSDPGIVFEQSRPSVNYWEPWYLGYHPKPWRRRGLITEENPAYGLYPRLISEGYDLHELHALMAPRPFLVSGGEEDPVRRWIPLNHTLAVYENLGMKNRVAMTNRPTHSPDQNSNEIAYLFFEYFLK